MKTKYIITALVMVFSPVQAFAAWYNPFTWFQDNLSTSTESVIAIEVTEPTFTTTTEDIVESEATSTVQTVTKTVVETQVVTKYVDNPVLIKENQELKAQIAMLLAKVSTLEAKVVELRSEVTPTTSVNQPLLGNEQTPPKTVVPASLGVPFAEVYEGENRVSARINFNDAYKILYATQCPVNSPARNTLLEIKKSEAPVDFAPRRWEGCSYSLRSYDAQGNEIGYVSGVISLTQ